MTPSTSWLKLFALGLVAWGLFGSHAAGNLDAVMLVALLALVALVDAGQASKEDGREKGEDSTSRVSDADIGAVVRRLLGVEVGPFYVALMVLAGVGMIGKEGEAQKRGETDIGSHAPALAHPSMCGGSCGSSSGGCGSGGCGASSGGACGCSGGTSRKTSAPKPKPAAVVPDAASKARAAAIQQRTIALPGIAPDAKPLHPSLKPNPEVKLPPNLAPTVGGGTMPQNAQAVVPAQMPSVSTTVGSGQASSNPQTSDPPPPPDAKAPPSPIPVK